MKQLWHMIERYYPWLLLLLGVDCFFRCHSLYF